MADPSQIEEIRRQTLKFAEDLRAETDGKINALIEKARKRGKERGEKKAVQLNSQLEALSKVIENEVGRELRSASIAIAEKLLALQVKNHPKTVVLVVQNAIKMMPEARNILLRVNPEDLDAVRAAKVLLSEIKSNNEQFDIKSDPQVQVGGVLIETESGVIDAEPKSQIDEIKNQLGL